MEITILGQRITLRVNDSDQEAVREVIELVSDRIRGAETRVKRNAAPHQVAVLALLDLAEQYIEARNKTQEFKAKMSDKSKRLIGLLEGELRATTGAQGKPLASLPRELSQEEDLPAARPLEPSAAE